MRLPFDVVNQLLTGFILSKPGSSLVIPISSGNLLLVLLQDTSPIDLLSCSSHTLEWIVSYR